MASAQELEQKLEEKPKKKHKMKDFGKGAFVSALAMSASVGSVGLGLALSATTGTIMAACFLSTIAGAELGSIITKPNHKSLFFLVGFGVGACASLMAFSALGGLRDIEPNKEELQIKNEISVSDTSVRVKYETIEALSLQSFFNGQQTIVSVPVAHQNITARKEGMSCAL